MVLRGIASQLLQLVFALKRDVDFRDKAGGYGFQGIGGCLIEKIEGDYYTIIGLPLYSLAKQLNQMFSND